MENKSRPTTTVRKEKHTRYKERILDFIRDSDYGLTSSQIVSQLSKPPQKSVAWRTVIKCLQDLTNEGLIQTHTLGAYKIYLARKVGEQSIYPVLYYAAIKIGGNIVQGEKVKAGRVPEVLREVWEELGDQVAVPHEMDIPAIKGPPTSEMLERLLMVLKSILCEFGYFGNYPKVEIVPPLGQLTPMTRHIRLTDPGFIAAGAGGHYTLLAGLLQEKLIQKTGFKVMFRVAHEIRPGDEEVEFEFGFVDHYIVDLSVVERRDLEKSPRDYLDAIKRFLLMFFRTTFREFMVGDTLHYEITTLDNSQVENFFVSRSRAILQNLKTSEQLHIQPTRRGLAWKDWPPGPPYVVVDFATNLGFFFETFAGAIRVVMPQAGYCLHLETMRNGVRMHFLEKEDFEIFFANFVDDKIMREQYRFFGITSEDYFRERRLTILTIAQEVIKESADRRMKKRKKTKETIKNETTRNFNRNLASISIEMMRNTTQDKIPVQKSQNSPIKKRIFNLIQDSDFGLTSSQIASQLGVAWRTVNKYLEDLTKEGRIQPHPVGAYTVFLARKVGEQSMYPVLYYAALQIGETVVQGEDVKTERIPATSRQVWERLENQVIVPQEADIPAIKGAPTPEMLDRLLETLKSILCEFGYFGNYPKVEIVPPLGNLAPMTRHIRLMDPGFIAAGAGLHYLLLAGLLQEKMIQKTGYKIKFSIAREILPKDEVVEFELGLIDHYRVDISVFEQGDKQKSPHHYLEHIKNFFSTYFRTTSREFMVGDTLHCEIITQDNQQVEEFFVSRARSLQKNLEILEKYNILPTRIALAWEDWPPDQTYLVIDLVTNLGFFLDEFERALRKEFPRAGYCIHIETLENGIRMHFLEKEDFEMVFSPIIDDQAMREQYSFVGITSEDYFRERKLAIEEIAREMQKERHDRMARKRKNTKEKTESELT